MSHIIGNVGFPGILTQKLDKSRWFSIFYRGIEGAKARRKQRGLYLIYKIYEYYDDDKKSPCVGQYNHIRQR